MEKIKSTSAERGVPRINLIGLGLANSGWKGGVTSTTESITQDFLSYYSLLCHLLMCLLSKNVFIAQYARQCIDF